MGSPAFFILIFAVASVNDPAILIRGMPDLGAKPSAAVSAFNLIGEDADPAVPGVAPFPFLQLRLHHIENCRVDDGFVVSLHIILWDSGRAERAGNQNLLQICRLYRITSVSILKENISFK